MARKTYNYYFKELLEYKPIFYRPVQLFKLTGNFVLKDEIVGFVKGVIAPKNVRAAKSLIH